MQKNKQKQAVKMALPVGIIYLKRRHTLNSMNFKVNIKVFHMRIFRLMMLMVMALTVVAPIRAEAHDRNFWAWIFTPDPDPYTRPYLHDGKTPHVVEWADEDWTAQEWIDAFGSKDAVLKNLRRADIIEDTDTESGVLVIEVGQNFSRIGDSDKLRVAKFLDEIYGATTSRTQTMLFERDWGCLFCGSDTIGAYTKQGLQLQ